MFATATSRPVQAAFDGGRRTSAGGLPWLAEADAARGRWATVAADVPAWRRGAVQHARETLLRQRIVQLACGYEDGGFCISPRNGQLRTIGWTPISWIALNRTRISVLACPFTDRPEPVSHRVERG